MLCLALPGGVQHALGQRAARPRRRRGIAGRAQAGSTDGAVGAGGQGAAAAVRVAVDLADRPPFRGRGERNAAGARDVQGAHVGAACPVPGRLVRIGHGEAHVEKGAVGAPAGQARDALAIAGHDGRGLRAHVGVQANGAVLESSGTWEGARQRPWCRRRAPAAGPACSKRRTAAGCCPRSGAPPG